MKIKIKRVKKHGRRGIRIGSIEEIISEQVKRNGLLLKYSDKQNEEMVLNAIESDHRSIKHLKIITNEILDQLVEMGRLNIDL